VLVRDASAPGAQANRLLRDDADGEGVWFVRHTTAAENADARRKTQPLQNAADEKCANTYISDIKTSRYGPAVNDHGVPLEVSFEATLQFQP
jgi:hypothetical protein